MAHAVYAGMDPHRHAHAALAHRHTLPDDEIARRLTSSGYTQQALSGLLQKPSVTYADAVAALTKAADHGVMTHAETLDLSSKLPSDPTGLRAALEHFHQVSSHAGRLLGDEKRRRLGGVQR